MSDGDRPWEQLRKAHYACAGTVAWLEMYEPDGGALHRERLHLAQLRADLREAVEERHLELMEDEARRAVAVLAEFVKCLEAPDA